MYADTYGSYVAATIRNFGRMRWAFFKNLGIKQPIFMKPRYCNGSYGINTRAFSDQKECSVRLLLVFLKSGCSNQIMKSGFIYHRTAGSGTRPECYGRVKKLFVQEIGKD